LYSLLTYATKWFAWERDAQKRGTISAFLWRQAFEQTKDDYFAGLSCDCDDDGGTPTNGDDTGFCPNCGGYTVDLGEMEYMNMPFLTDIKCIDGKLVKYWGPCCSEVIECDTSADVPPSDYPVEGEGSACNKAYGMAAAFVPMVLAGLSSLNPDNNQEFMDQWMVNVPAISWMKGYLYSAASYYFLQDPPTDILNFYTVEDAVQWLACVWAVLLEDTDALTLAEFNSMLTSLASLQQLLGYNNNAVRDFTKNIMQAIPFLTWEWWAKTSYAVDAGTCMCPTPDDQPSNPDVNGWYWSASFTQSVECTGSYNTVMCMEHMLEHDAYGYRFQLARDDDSKNYKRMGGTFAGCGSGTSAWGDTSDHLEYEDQEYWRASGDETLLASLLGAEGLVQGTDWGLQSSNYGTPTNPASPSQTQGTVMLHGFTGDNMTTGDTYTVKMRLLMNINSPSHA